MILMFAVDSGESGNSGKSGETNTNIIIGESGNSGEYKKQPQSPQLS